jgi:hypothetical protein
MTVLHRPRIFRVLTLTTAALCVAVSVGVGLSAQETHVKPAIRGRVSARRAMRVSPLVALRSE